jgi:hypothetical protein
MEPSTATPPEPSPSSKPPSTPSSLNPSEALDGLLTRLDRLVEAVERLASKFDALTQANLDKWMVWLAGKGR